MGVENRHHQDDDINASGTRRGRPNRIAVKKPTATLWGTANKPSNHEPREEGGPGAADGRKGSDHQ
jgi:hypothetical protein